MDSRRPRIEVDFSVTFSGEDRSGRGTLINLTVAGAEIQSQVDCPIGTRLCVRVQTSGARPPIVISSAVVRWKKGDRFGIEFIRFEGQSKQQLEEMLDQHDSPLS